MQERATVGISGLGLYHRGEAISEVDLERHAVISRYRGIPSEWALEDLHPQVRATIRARFPTLKDRRPSVFDILLSR